MHVDIIIIRRGEERYAFIYDDDTYQEALRRMASFAANPKLNFTYHDAAECASKIIEVREQTKKM